MDQYRKGFTLTEILITLAVGMVVLFVLGMVVCRSCRQPADPLSAPERCQKEALSSLSHHLGWEVSSAAEYHARIEAGDKSDAPKLNAEHHERLARALRQQMARIERQGCAP